MNTSDLERRLAVVLQQHAEDAMNSTRTEEKLENLLTESERRRRRRLGWAAGAVAAAAAVVALIAWAVGPGTNQSEEVVSARVPPAKQVATAFLDAYAGFDRATAASYLADGAALSIWENSLGLEVWRQGNRWFEAIGFRLVPDKCDTQGRQGSETQVRCTFHYHALGSDELGRGPFSDNTFDFTVRDGKIIAADMELGFETNGFSTQMWEPFAAWVSEAYPKDAAVMYDDWPGQSLESLTTRSIRLWGQHTRDYVQAEKTS